MKTKINLNYDENNFFCIETLFIASIKNVMTFFNQTINNDVNDIISFR